MNNYIKFLNSYKKKDINYFDMINILNVNDLEYNNVFKKNNYEEWKDNHEIKNITFNEIQEVNIETNVNNISDFIDIINTHAYEKNKKYNIDLKALHYIKDELVELNNMIGMKEIKESIINQLIYFMQKLHINDDNSSDYKHTIIYGPPGTGKTEVAEIIGKIYSKIGVFKKNIFKKVTRSDLVAGYLGQTALKTNDVINSCLGGCLFIDEAYSLASDDLDSYSKECIDTLCEGLSRHKNDLMVIIAGYENEINELIMKTNKGLDSRFIWRFKIEEYGSKELCEILVKKIKDIKWSIDEDCINEKWFEDKKDYFKNYGRDIEKLLSNIKICHSKRIFGKGEEYKRLINLDDINNGFNKFIGNSNKKLKSEIFGLYI